MADISRRDETIAREVATLEAYGIAPTEAKAKVAGQYGLSPRRVYDICRMADADVQQYATNGNGRTGMFGEAGLTGLSYSGGYVNEEFLSDLKTPSKRYKAFNEMRQNSPVVASILWAVELAIRSVEWRVDGDDERAEFIEECRQDTSHSWEDHLSEALTMLPFGWSWFEIVYKRRNGPNAAVSSNYSDGRIGWRKFAFRSQDSLHEWQFDDSGNVQAMQQSTWPNWDTRIVPLQKSILYRTTREKNNPEGRSILRPAYVPYYYVKNLQAIEAIGAERDLAGLPMLVAPEGTDLSESSPAYVRATALLRRIRMDEAAGALVPPGWEFSLVSSAGGKNYNVGEIIARHERRMAMVILAQFLMLGMDSVGSFSLSSDHSDFFEMAISAFADIIAETFSRFAIQRLLKLNGMDLTNAPKLAHGPVGTPALEQISQFFSQLGVAGFIKPDDELEQYLRTMVHAPELTEEQLAEREEERGEMRELRRQIPQQPAQQTGEDDGAAQTSRPVANQRIFSRYQQLEEPPRLKWRETAGVFVNAPTHIITEDDVQEAVEQWKRSGATVDLTQWLEAELGLDERAA